LKASLDTLLVAAAQHETARLRKESQLDQAIAMLERLHGQSRLAGIRESLCIAYTDRGQENLAAQAWDAARAGFQKALDLDASCLPAKQGMCRAYNNEAMAIEDKEKALPLLQKAIEYDPDNTAVRDNLAQEFNAKAVRLLNAPNCSVDDVNRAMGLLQAGGLTIRPDLDEPFFETFVIRSGAGYEEEIHKLPEGVFKWILGNLQIACKRRENFALEFNSKAVAILNAPGCSSRDAGEAINLLRAAALTTRPDLSRQYVDTFIAGDGAGYAEEISKLPEGAFRLILQNLQVACQRRRS
jgi:tetratricopeptide (TPR) repeat protein